MTVVAAAEVLAGLTALKALTVLLFAVGALASAALDREGPALRLDLVDVEPLDRGVEVEKQDLVAHAELLEADQVERRGPVRVARLVRAVQAVAVTAGQLVLEAVAIEFYASRVLTIAARALHPHRL